MGDCRVAAILNQFIAFKVLNLHEISTRYRSPKAVTEADIALVAFSDGSDTKESSHLRYIVGL